MTRRPMLQVLTFTVLIAALSCSLSPASALAKSGKGHGKSEEHKQQRGQTENQRQAKEKHQPQKYKQQAPTYTRQVPKEHRQTPRDRKGYSEKSQERQSLSPQQAAQRARSQYGGQVLKVSPTGQGYQVRLLKDDGRVMSVPVAD